MSDWYYAQDNQQKGPVNEAELKEYLATGKVPATALVWKEGMDSWLPAGQVPAFSFRPPPAPAKVQPGSVAPGKPLSAAPQQPTSQSQTEDVADKVKHALESFSEGEGTPGDPDDVEKNKMLATIAYLPPLLFLVPLLTAKESPFARYHANQAIVLTIALIPLSIVVSIAQLIIGMIPVLGFLIDVVLSLGILGIYGFFAYLGIMSAQKGVTKPLPFIGDKLTILK